MATQSPQSLPSFAQTFGPGPAAYNTRMPDINNSLPPLQQRRASPFDRDQKSPALSTTPQPTIMVPKQNSRKRLHAETISDDAEESPPSDGRRSPRTVRIKEEVEHDTLTPPAQPRITTAGTSLSRESLSSTPPTGSPNPAKKRRVTLSSLAPPINTDVRRPSMDSGISPVVMGLSIQRDDPTALEQVRSMLSVKQKQKALIEQRRGSTAGIIAPVAPPSVNIVNPRPGSEEAQGPSSNRASRGGRSPSMSNNRRRSVVSVPSTAPTPNLAAPSSSSRPISPNPAPAPTQQQTLPPPRLATQDTQHSPVSAAPPPPPPAPSHLHPSASGGSTGGPGVPPPPAPPSSLPPPPTSFARRRAGRQLGGGKAKPADIMISLQPNASQMPPSIHSAPPIPRAGQQPGRFPSMAIPTLPPSIKAAGQAPMRLAAGQVPPTPTRLTLARHSVAHPGVGGISGRSPNTASVPIAQTLVPPTPAFHHSGYSGEKSAFLAPFEMFYDALSDSKELKKWLGEQLQKSHVMISTLQKQQDHMEEIINSIVDKKVSAMREEVYGLRVRVDELESVLRVKGSSGYSPGMTAAKAKSKTNGHNPSHASTSGPPVFDSYTFPPVDPLQRDPRRPEPVHRLSSPDVDPRSTPGSQTSSPVPFDISKQRLSVSAMRLDPPLRASGDLMPPTARPSFRERERERDREREANHSYSSLSGRRSPRGIPTSSTRSSLNQSHSASMMSRGPGPSSSQSQGQRFSVAVDKHQYKDGTASADPSGEGRVERGAAEGAYPASSQRRNSIAAPPTVARAERGERGEREWPERRRPRSPMDTA